MHKKRDLRKILVQAEEIKMKQEDLRRLFEHKFISKRIEFLQDSDFEYLENEYLLSKLIEYTQRNYSGYYLSLLIDVAVVKEIIDEILIEEYKRLLTTSKSLLVRLSVIDYLILCKGLIYDDSELIDRLHRILNKERERVLIKNQVLLLLILITPSSTRHYRSDIVKNLKKTSDYRAHIRTYSTIISDTELIDKLRGSIPVFIEISLRKDLGKALNSQVKEVADFYNL